MNFSLNIFFKKFIKAVVERTYVYIHTCIYALQKIHENTSLHLAYIEHFGPTSICFSLPKSHLEFYINCIYALGTGAFYCVFATSNWS